VKLVIVGNGIAAITAARAVRSASPDAQIDIYTDEPYHYYLRPRLIQFIAGDLDQQGVYVYSPEWYGARGLSVHLSATVIGLDTIRRKIALESGEEVAYDRLLLACGSHAFRPPLEGVDQEGVFTLRSMGDALAISGYVEKCILRGRREAAVIGGGLMGLECANALARRGLEVTVLQGGPWLLNRQIDAHGAEVLERHLERLGVRCLSGVRPKAILSNGGATGVCLEDGRSVEGYLILCAAGVRANTDLAVSGGLAVGQGVLVDSEMCASADGVYAAGDVTEHYGEAWRIIPAAINQARVAAANLVRPGSMMYEGTVPSTTLKVVGVDLTSIGVIEGELEGMEELRRTDHDSGVHQKLVLQDGRIVGAVLLGSKERVPAVARLIQEGTDVSNIKHLLLEEEFDLQSLLD
jgi:nitrite reductase (NADH) large subunit